MIQGASGVKSEGLAQRTFFGMCSLWALLASK